MTQRLHYSDVPLEVVRFTPIEKQRMTFKPEGLWYSIGTEWKDWCETNNFGREYLAHVASILLDESKLLIISNVEELQRFHEEYAIDSMMVDWKRVTQDYAGIEINPCIWGFDRFAMYWYTGWDVASGCIWDVRSVKIRDKNPASLRRLSRR